MNNAEKERAAAVRLTILETLAPTPDDYMQPQAALFKSLRYLMVPEVKSEEFTAALERLEEDALIRADRGSLIGTRWSITELGRTRLKAL